jgi:hypothetical protein
MKINHSLLILLVCLGLVATVAIFLIRPFYSPISHRIPSDSEINNAQNITQHSKNQPEVVDAKEKTDEGITNQQLEKQFSKMVFTNTLLETNQRINESVLLKTTIDLQSGQYAVVSPDKQTVMLKDKNNNIIWSTNVLTICGTAPISGGREISAMKLVGNSLWVTIGRHSYVYIDIPTGKVTIFGSD